MPQENILFPFLGAVLLCVSLTDLMRHRIPNALSLGSLFIAVLLQSWLNGFSGTLASLGGAAIGLGLFLPLYALRGMSAGDVKLMAAVGGFLGPKLVLQAVVGTLLVGAIIGLAVTLTKGGGFTSLRRYKTMALTFFRTSKWVYIPPQPGEAAGRRFPYAIAILTGSGAALWWSTGTIFGVR